MIYKEWPDTVFLRKEGRYWQVYRLEQYRRRDFEDVLHLGISRVDTEAVVAERGYAVAAGDEGRTPG